MIVDEKWVLRSIATPYFLTANYCSCIGLISKMGTPSCFSSLVLYFSFFFPVTFMCARLANGDANATAASCSSSSLQCANLGNHPYPFGNSTACAASPSYVLSNCTASSKQAYWDSFSHAALGVVGPPAVFAVAPATVDQYSYTYIGGASQTKIQLSWNNSLIDSGNCPPLFSSTNLSLYNIPSSIDLTRFSDVAALQLSQDNTFLLFNCAHNASAFASHLDYGYLEDESYSGCMPYKVLCKSLANAPCIEWSVYPSTNGGHAIMLKDVLESLACSHFMFGISSVNDVQQFQWFTASIIEVLWTDIQCDWCQGVNGQCEYYDTFPEKFSHCECFNGTILDANSTQTCSDPWDGFDVCFGGILQCNTGAKIGIGVAIIVAVLGILVIFQKLIRPGFLKVTVPFAISVLKKILRKLQTVSYGPRHVLNLIDLDGLTERPMEYTYNTIAAATKSFSSLVGEGGFGAVYKGTLSQASSHGGSESQIAVKVLETKSKHSKKQFLNEVVTIGKIHHVNVVRLLGFCMQEDHKMLVYEYVVNGSLDRWLFDKKDKPQEQFLDWGQRYAIALGVARGLSYLHEECRHRTVHCDIKPQNILLDENMHPKIADFGLARLMDRNESKVVTLAKGTPGYMAPEFWMGGEGQLSTKFDVYSYGMVLLELISGQRIFQGLAVASARSFPAMVFNAATEGDLDSIVDARLEITSHADEAQKQVQWQQIKTAVFVALWCIQDHPERRLHMSEVVKYLEGGATVFECPPQPIISISYESLPQREFYATGSDHEKDWTPLTDGR